MHKIVRKIGFNNWVTIDCNGSGRDRSGGLCLLWKDECNIQIKAFSSNYIGGGYTEENDDARTWCFAGIYGYPIEPQKKETWRMVQSLCNELGERLILFGDFNDMTQQSEKKRGNLRSQSQFMWSRKTMERCGLQDLGYKGYPFTWSNGRGGFENIQCRLDRGFATSTFMESFPHTQVVHLPRNGSDHAVLRLMIKIEVVQQKKKAVFRFEEIWAKDVRCEGWVKHLWREANGSFSHKLSNL